MNDLVTPWVYPLRLEAELDAPLSRWLWLVKWVLIIPHVFVLFFLWIAFVVSTVMAFFAILVTGRYPRGIFDFNVACCAGRGAWPSTPITRWDRPLPAVHAADVPGYPARLEVDYPSSLSRGLVLVKWWLLAIPQYLIVSVFAGGAWAGYGAANDSWTWTSSGGLIGLLVFIAATCCCSPAATRDSSMTSSWA